MKVRWRLWRVVAVVIAGSLLAYGVFMMVDGNRRQRNYEEWQTAKPVDGEVDFSQPGRVELPFTQTCSTSHGEVVSLRVAPKQLGRMAVRMELDRLQAALEIVEKSGGRVVTSAKSERLAFRDASDGEVPLFYFAPFPRGEYVATVTVTRGVPALKGVDQRLEGRYQLCGMEELPAQISRVIGIVSLVVGGLVGLSVFRRMRAGRSDG